MKTLFKVLAWPFVKIYDLIRFILIGIWYILCLPGIFVKSLFELTNSGWVRVCQALHYGLIRINDKFKNKPLIFSGYPQGKKPEQQTFDTPYHELKDWHFKRSHNEEEGLRSVVDIIADYCEYSENPVKYVRDKQKVTVNENFLRSHRWVFEFGNEEDDKALLYARSLKFSSIPTLTKPGRINIEFYSCPKVIDFLARNPKTRQARIVFQSGDGNMVSYVELEKIKLEKVDITSMEFDYTKTDVNVVSASFVYRRHKIYGTVASNGPMEKPIVA